MRSLVHTARALSTKGTVSSTKTLQAASPGIPLTAPPPVHSGFLAVKLPTPPQTLPQSHASVQVPYVPDFWNSARSKSVAPLEPVLPKLHVVSGSATHYDGGPLHSLEEHREVGAPSTAVDTHAPLAPTEVGFWPDLWESLGLPRSFSPRRALSEAAMRAEESQARSRPLTDEERKGLYVLLGIVAGSWLVGGLVDRPAVAAEAHGTQDKN